ncbi:MAG: polysaccharide deacetylase family protein, partial [Gemmatimonadota bacterium]|nr:polysaccharide deacetylase family protein [Gemmatimonadota bacterium]
MPDVLTAVGAALGRRRAARRWRRLESGSAALILAYHRVADLPADPNGLAVHPERFAGHLELLRRNYRPLPLRTLIRDLAENRLPERAVVITFDDGYEDNLTQARPLLARHDVPATVFVVSGQVGAGREFWWDELEQIVLRAGELPRDLGLELDGGSFRFSFDGDARWTEADLERHRDWNLRSRHDPTARHRLF